MAFMDSQPQLSKSLVWHFPLPRPHTGVPLGNGNQGVLVWGEDSLLLTVSRAGFWDHRGGNEFTTRATFAKVRACLEADDETGINALFAVPQEGSSSMLGDVATADNAPDRPFQIGGGRIELRFEDGLKPVSAVLVLADASLEVTLANASGRTATVRIHQAMDAELTWIELDEAAHGPVQVSCLPSWHWVGAQLAAWGIQEPRQVDIHDGGGFVQELPDDDDLALVWRRRDRKIFIATALGECEAASKAAVKLARELPPTDSKYFWDRYWRDVPTVALPDAELQHFWDLALYKQAGITTPDGVAATLQGPWMEEYQLPPWSNDYHFNINAEMIYWPALATNRLDHFKPLWALIGDWLAVLRANGEKFFEQPGALMLPHAVDDQCQVVGTFWTGTIDHACTAWMAQMAWLHYRYGMDEKVLRDTAWPLLNGAFEGYWAMHEVVDGRFSLPISVSPEYRASRMDAWGRDASFQLAAWHRVSEVLQEAAAILGTAPDPRWGEVRDKAPHYSLVNGRVGLWAGLELEESHRHHSHLAGIFPFQSFDPFDAAHWKIVVPSIEFWNVRGSGMWTGWCIPWASALCSRLELPDAAVTWMHWLLDNFTNVGWGTLHNADFPGAAAWHDGSLLGRAKPSGEVMQMDATMGFLTAVTELLVQNRRDAIYVLPKLPRRWRQLSFDGIRCEGAFLVGATVTNGATTAIRILSEKGGLLRLAHGLGDRFLLDGRESSGGLLQLATQPGQRIELSTVIYA